MAIPPNELRKLIESHPDRGPLPIECVMAVCMVESSLNPWAYRYEPSYKWLVGQDLSASERCGQMISWGLMQVMGGVAREHGFTGPYPALCDPMTSLRYGMLHLRKFWAKYQNWPDTLASYNAGRPVRIDGKYQNQAYIDKVLKWWNQYETHVPLKESEV